MKLFQIGEEIVVNQSLISFHHISMVKEILIIGLHLLLALESTLISILNLLKDQTQSNLDNH
jgi:hypothetical protein